MKNEGVIVGNIEYSSQFCDCNATVLLSNIIKYYCRSRMAMRNNYTSDEINSRVIN